MGLTTKAIHLNDLRGALGELNKQLTLPELVCLLTIAELPGISVSELAESTGLPQQSVSRHASGLLGRYERVDGRLPLKLIEQRISDADPRKRALYITVEGTTVLSVLWRNT